MNMTVSAPDTATAASAPVRTIAWGADIGGSFIKFGRIFGAGEVALIEQVPTPVDSWDGFVAALAGLIARHGAAADALPLAISVAGLYDTRSGAITAANIPCFDGHDVPGELSAGLGCDVVIANDADSFALAEAVVGAGRGHEVVFGAILGTGVGGGLVIGGRVVQGMRGITGEWGHGPIAPLAVEVDGEMIAVPQFPCGCGLKGCLDPIGSARGLERLHQHYTGRDETSYQILDAWEAGNADAARTVAIWAQVLGGPLGFVLNTLGASIVPVGGGLANRPDLIAALDQVVRKGTLNTFEAPVLVPGQHRGNGGLIGVSVLAAQHLSGAR
ncbi:ROK family protein [Ketogulonicigenium vulgare]|uniref:ROK family protein n=1 Tax=Ketogulonicigenium vulgare TaxID=92945 RepID=UPI002359BB11|nr:ROK family protein [Ketogulonicigenium vulgare]